MDPDYVKSTLDSYFDFFRSDKFMKLSREDKEDKVASFIDFLLKVDNEEDSPIKIMIPPEALGEHGKGKAITKFSDIVDMFGKQKIIDALVSSIENGDGSFLFGDMSNTKTAEIMGLMTKYPLSEIKRVTNKLKNGEDLTEEEEKMISEFHNDLMDFKTSNIDGVIEDELFKGTVDIIGGTSTGIFKHTFDHERLNYGSFIDHALIYTIIGSITDKNSKIYKMFIKDGIMEVFEYLMKITHKLTETICDVFNKENIDYDAGIIAMLFFCSGVCGTMPDDFGGKLNNLLKLSNADDSEEMNRRIFKDIMNFFLAYYSTISLHGNFESIGAIDKDKCDLIDDANESIRDLIDLLNDDSVSSEEDNKSSEEDNKSEENEVSISESKTSNKKVVKNLRSLLMED